MQPVARKLEQYYWYPRFSPDGKSILAKHLDARDNAVVGDHPDISLRIIGLDTSRESSMEVVEGLTPEMACWSPDGRYIATVAYSGNSEDSKILIIDSKGTLFKEIALPNVDRMSLSDVQWATSPKD